MKYAAAAIVLVALYAWGTGVMKAANVQADSQYDCVSAKLDALPNQSDRLDHIRQFTRECNRR